MWHDDFAVDAVVSVAFDYWMGSLENVRKKNVGKGFCPGSVDDLARLEYMNRHRGTLYRLPPTSQNLLGNAIAHGVPTRTVILEEVDWLARVTRRICGGRVSGSNSTAYALYRVHLMRLPWSEPPLRSYEMSRDEETKERNRAFLLQQVREAQEIAYQNSGEIRNEFIRVEDFIAAVYKVANTLEQVFSERRSGASQGERREKAMNEFSTQDYLDYLRGQSSPELAAAIESAHKADAEVAFRLDTLRSMIGLPLPSSQPVVGPSPLRANSRRYWGKVALCAVPLLLGVGFLLASYLGYFKQTTIPQRFPAVERDNEPRHFTKVVIARPGVVVHRHGYILIDRGSLVTYEDYSAPYEVRFDWRWIDHPGDTRFPEILSVVLHTAGQHSLNAPFSIPDGLHVLFLTANGQVRVASSIGNRPIAHTPEYAVRLSAGEWNTIRVVDDGREISIFVNPRGEKESQQPLLSVRDQGPFLKHRVAVYNREAAGDRPHESHIANFRVRSLKKASQP